MRQENNKGVMDAFRNPKPEWWMVKMAYSPVGIAARTVSPIDGSCAVSLTNHYSFTDLNELSCHWTALKGGTTLQDGILHVTCPPMQSTMAHFSAPAGMTALRLEFDKSDGTSTTLATLTVPDGPTPAPPAALANGEPLAVQDSTNTLRVASSTQEIVFDKSTGGVRFWRVREREILTGNPALNLGEGMASTEKGYYHAAAPTTLMGAAVQSASQPDGSVRVTVISHAQGDGKPLGTLTYTYNIRPNAEIELDWTLNWAAADTLLWEAGMVLPVPTVYSQVEWWRDSFFTAYPSGHIGEPTGRCEAGDILFRASKRSLHWMTLTDVHGTGLALLQHKMPLVARATSDPQGISLLASEELAVPHEFDGVWVNEHDIAAVKGKSLSGSFILRAISDITARH